jgi:hypothetical protein
LSVWKRHKERTIFYSTKGVSMDSLSVWKTNKENVVDNTTGVLVDLWLFGMEIKRDN